MNAKRVNGAAGVILAALEQNRTPAGIALALESAGLLMTPEAAADLASTSADAVDVAERAVAELKQEHERLETVRALCDAAEYVGIVSGGWFTVEAVRRAANGEPLPKPDGITRRIAPTQALRVCAGCASYGECLKDGCPKQPAEDAAP